MSEPLTDEELENMSRTKLIACSLCPRAAAEISKLRERLKKYGKHTNRCGWTHFSACDCGLDDLQKENDDERRQQHAGRSE